MNKKIIAAAALALVSGAALATDGVSLFGIMDTGIMTQNNTPGGKGTQTQMWTNGLRQSVWGIKGSEDLGDGTKAFFNLESHIDINTGQLHGTGDPAGTATPLFRRQANVGLTNADMGTLTLGKQYGPVLLAVLETEPRLFKEQFSNLYMLAYSQINTAGTLACGANTTASTCASVNSNNDVGIFMDNAVQYSNAVGPVNFGLLYSLGGQAGSTNKNQAYALGVTYHGPVVLAGGYQAFTDTATGNNITKFYTFGGAYTYGAVTFRANFMDSRNFDPSTQATLADVQGISGGADWTWSTRNTATLAYYNNQDKNHTLDQTRNVVLSNDFHWSKRTTLYAQAAYVQADSGAKLDTSIVASGSVANTSTLYLNVGVNHTF